MPHLYRCAYEYPRTGEIGRATFVAWSRFGAVRYAALLAKLVGGYLLSIKEERPAIMAEQEELILR